MECFVPCSLDQYRRPLRHISCAGCFMDYMRLDLLIPEATDLVIIPRQLRSTATTGEFQWWDASDGRSRISVRAERQSRLRARCRPSLRYSLRSGDSVVSSIT